MKYRTFVPKHGPNRGKKVRIAIRKHKRSGRGKRRITAHMRRLGKAAKACRGQGKIGSKRRTACIVAHLKRAA